jgi:LPXTG-motif cell wall-anchored protein
VEQQDKKHSSPYPAPERSSNTCGNSEKADSLPETGNNSSTLAIYGLLSAITGFALANRRRTFQ